MAFQINPETEHGHVPAQRKAAMSEDLDPIQGSGVSRRGFLKGFGATTVATGLLETSLVEAAEAKGKKTFGPGEMPITLEINGQSRKLNVEPRVTLLDALRNRLDLTGAKKVCDRGTCGACTVMVDGHPVYSCSMLAVEAVGRKITTVEALGTPEKLTPIQQAFIKHDAQQCGFCTPGFIVACTAFLAKNPKPTLEEVRAGLGGNLCRCGTYAGMMEAVVAAGLSKGGRV
jgi:xanthine dehydrogenase YagT iron-sulfur-binding subunit